MSERQEDFTLVTRSSHHQLYDDYNELFSSHAFEPVTFLIAALRRQYPELCLTVTNARSPALLDFAAAGHAISELDTETDSIERFRGYYPGDERQGISEQLVEGRTFAKYHYRWGSEDFIVYIVQAGYAYMNYILKEPVEGETVLSNSSVTDRLMMAVGRWQYPEDDEYVFVYDGYWQASKELWRQVQKAEWKDVILNENMKTTLVDLMKKFFDSEVFPSVHESEDVLIYNRRGYLQRPWSSVEGL